MPLVSLTRATFLNAEFGFLGVTVRTMVHTPRFCGFCLSAGDFDFTLGVDLPFLTSWLTVGIFGFRHSAFGFRLGISTPFCGKKKAPFEPRRGHTRRTDGSTRYARSSIEPGIASSMGFLLFGFSLKQLRIMRYLGGWCQVPCS